MTEANLLVVNRGYRTVEGLSRLIKLKSAMNTNRTFFLLETFRGF